MLFLGGISAADVLPLAGEWRFALDPADQGSPQQDFPDATGSLLAKASVEASSRRQAIHFPHRLMTRRLTLRITASRVPPFAAIAEIDLLP